MQSIFKFVFLKVQNVLIRPVFPGPVTFDEIHPVIMLKIIFRNTVALKINRNFFVGKSCREMRHHYKVSLCQASVKLQRVEEEVDVFKANQGC